MSISGLISSSKLLHSHYMKASPLVKIAACLYGAEIGCCTAYGAYRGAEIGLEMSADVAEWELKKAHTTDEKIKAYAEGALFTAAIPVYSLGGAAIGVAVGIILPFVGIPYALSVMQRQNLIRERAEHDKMVQENLDKRIQEIHENTKRKIEEINKRYK